ncbi:hypothetical protein V5799_014177 [Amblyomma americanum]|uniref:Uncharacterized protein n=1 Tax=Amblyomma americanum TaxID=6943 RepID=A0AAQ4E3T2_AMBAM
MHFYLQFIDLCGNVLDSEEALQNKVRQRRVRFRRIVDSGESEQEEREVEPKKQKNANKDNLLKALARKKKVAATK